MLCFFSCDRAPLLGNSNRSFPTFRFPLPSHPVFAPHQAHCQECVRAMRTSTAQTGLRSYGFKGGDGGGTCSGGTLREQGVAL